MGNGQSARMLMRVRAWAAALRRDVLALWLAARDSRTPLGAKLLSALVVAYALSPIDLIPDVIPVLGLLDDLILVSLGIAAAARLIPPPLMRALRDEARLRARAPRSGIGAAIVLCLWVIGAALLWRLTVRQS